MIRVRGLFTIALATMSAPSYAYVPTIGSNGTLRKWSTPAPEFFVNQSNGSGLSAANVFSMLTNALGRWKAAGTSSVTFDYWQGTTTVPAAVSYDGRNTVFFQSQSSNISLGSGVIGVTYIYSSGSQILETDMVFNDVNFTFTTDPSDTTNLTSSTRVYLESVAVHEFGHAYGLSHSNNLQSAMMWQEARGQSKLSCDDINGIAALYPNSAYTAQLGSISGTLRSSAGSTAVFGAYVHAISKRRGTVVATAISGSNGAFVVENLEPGEYILFVEPFTSITSSLCGGSSAGCYWGTANANSVCSGSAFKRFFIESTAGAPRFLSVSAGTTTGVGNINVTCSGMTQVLSDVTNYNGATPSILPSASSSTRAAATGVFTAVNDVHYLKLTNVSGAVSARVLSFSLYSKADVTVDIIDGGGNSVATTVKDEVYPASTYTANVYNNYDAEASGTIAVAGDHYVKVTYANDFSVGINMTEGYSNRARYPGASAIDSLAFYLVIVTVGDTTAYVNDSLGSPYLTVNARCEKSDSFSSYPNRGTPPAPAQSSSSSSSSGGAGATIKKVTSGCGTIMAAHEANRGGDDESGGPTAGEFFFSAWGLILSMCAARLTYRSYLSYCR